MNVVMEFVLLASLVANTFGYPYEQLLIPRIVEGPAILNNQYQRQLLPDTGPLFFIPRQSSKNEQPLRTPCSCCAGASQQRMLCNCAQNNPEDGLSESFIEVNGLPRYIRGVAETGIIVDEEQQPQDIPVAIVGFPPRISIDETAETRTSVIESVRTDQRPLPAFSSSETNNERPLQTPRLLGASVSQQKPADTPVIAESVRRDPSPPSAFYPFGRDDEAAFMATVESALKALQPLLGGGEAPRDRDVIIPTSDANTKKKWFDRSPTQNYGTYYNLRVQSFNTIHDQLGEEANKKTESETESKEKKINEQHEEILDELEQLSRDQLAILLQLVDTEVMTERGFKLQESYLREIKRQLNLMKTAGESSRNKVAANEEAASSTESLNAASQSETTTFISAVPDTTSAVPTATLESSTNIPEV